MSPKGPCVRALVSYMVVLGGAVKPSGGGPSGCFLDHGRVIPKGTVGLWPVSPLFFGCLGDEVSDFALAHTRVLPGRGPKVTG